MKITILLLTGIVLIWIVLLTAFGMISRTGKSPGLSDNRLSLCPESPNCICTEYESDKNAFSNPVPVPLDNPDVMNEVQSVILAMGGKILSRDQYYLAAIFSSRLFGLIDDFEIRWDPESGLLHIRSASRTGYTDLGVNTKRVDDFKFRYNTITK